MVPARILIAFMSVCGIYNNMEYFTRNNINYEIDIGLPPVDPHSQQRHYLRRASGKTPRDHHFTLRDAYVHL